MKILSFMKKYSRWSFLSNFGKNKIVKRTYVYLFFVPFIINTLNKFGFQEIIDSIPFSWQMFFLSAIMFTIGSIVYFLFAPKIILENDSFAEFKNTGKIYEHIKEYMKEIELDFEYAQERWVEFAKKNNLNPQEVDPDKKSEFLTFFRIKYPLKEDTLNFIFDYWVSRRNYSETANKISLPKGYNILDAKLLQEFKDAQFEKDLKYDFKKTFEFADTYRKIARYLCASFYFAGMILFSLVTLNSILIVFKMGRITLFKLI